MTWPLGDIMNRIREELRALEPKDLAKTDRATPQWHQGFKHLKSTARRPPSYCWWPTDIRPAAAFKGDIGADEAVATGAESVEVHSWGVTEELAWTLRHNLISAAREIFDADCAYIGCVHIEPEENGYGLGWITRLAFNVPVIGRRFEIAVPAEVIHTGFLVVDGNETEA